MKAWQWPSLNTSLPEALKNYVEGQVASGDWGTPSEFIRELIRQDKERRLGNLEQELNRRGAWRYGGALSCRDSGKRAAHCPA
jgi:putative addiction module CopG family antidote